MVLIPREGGSRPWDLQSIGYDNARESEPGFVMTKEIAEIAVVEVTHMAVMVQVRASIEERVTACEAERKTNVMRTTYHLLTQMQWTILFGLSLIPPLPHRPLSPPHSCRRRR